MPAAHAGTRSAYVRAYECDGSGCGSGGNGGSSGNSGSGDSNSSSISGGSGDSTFLEFLSSQRGVFPGDPGVLLEQQLQRRR